MSFIDEINYAFSFKEGFASFKATLLGREGVYFEGVKEIKSFSLEKIELRLKKGEALIEGEGLCIKKLCLGDVAIVGKIKSVTLS